MTPRSSTASATAASSSRGCAATSTFSTQDALALQLPKVAYDLPGGARRLVQSATGYVATVVAGEVTLRAGEDTGARPGRLVRGSR